MGTIKDVAEKAGVSISTVSRALSGNVPVSPETKAKIFQAVEELNYRPNAVAQGLKNGKSRTIGLVIPNFRSLVFPIAIQGIAEVADRHGYTLILCNTEEDTAVERQYINNLRRRLIDGLIFTTATAESEHILQLKEEGFPVVLLLRQMEAAPVDAVIADNFQGAYEGAGFLLDRGYRRIGFVNGTLKLDLYRQRFAGFKQALRDRGVSAEEALISHDAAGWEDGYRAMQRLLALPSPPEAVFATSDPKAFGVIKAIRERGLAIPEEIAVLGFDNLETAQLVSPPLTTIAQPFYEMGKRAGERLVRLMQGEDTALPIVEKLPVELVVRDSVGTRQ